MPPRIREFPCLQALKSALPCPNGQQVAPRIRTFTATASHQKKGAKIGQQHRYRDPYVVAQARARKAANLSKQEALKIDRAKALGDPVRGKETEFLKSFDITTKSEGTEEHQFLNHFLKQHEIDTQLLDSKRLVEPAKPTTSDIAHSQSAKTPGAERQNAEIKHARNIEQWEKAHETVQEAVKRITNIDNGSSKDRLRINVERCIQTFGRHKTDKELPRHPTAVPLGPGGVPLVDQIPQISPLKRRLGPDTGSSEVQIAILTAKIRNVANHMGRVGNSDKMNKRNLRLLVHKRQKLLQYLRRKERGGPRWQKCIEMLGLTEGTWRGEITL